DHIAGVDHARLRVNIGLHRRNLAAFDQHVGPVEIPDIAIEAQHHAAFEQCAGRANLSKNGCAAGTGRQQRCRGGSDETAAVDLSLPSWPAPVIVHGSVLPKPRLTVTRMSKYPSFG